MLRVLEARRALRALVSGSALDESESGAWLGVGAIGRHAGAGRLRAARLFL
jgi:hypothetical protein